MRNKLTILLITFFAFSSVKFALPEFSLNIGPAGSDKISLYEKRFAPLRNILSPNAVLGYVTDIPGDRVVSDPDSLARFYVTQYAIAPSVIVNTSDAGLVLGDFIDKNKASANPDINGLVPRVSLGNGVILFSREKR